MDRQTVKTDLLAEFAAHQPGQAMRYMRKWSGGALSLVHMQVLAAIDTDGALSMRRLAETLDVSQASATGIVDRMEQRGLVERTRDDEDRRVVRVGLTEQGRRTIGGLAAERLEHLGQILDQLTDDELAGLLVGLTGMRRGRELLHERLRAAHEAENPGVRFHDDIEPPADAPPPTQSPTPDTEPNR